MARLIRAKVEEGSDASNSEVIREALHTWQAPEQLRAERLASVRARITEADADPRPSLSEDDVTHHFEARRRAPRPAPMI